jgi:hypothetical protein
LVRLVSGSSTTESGSATTKSGSALVGSRTIVGLARVGNIGNVARVSISDTVPDGLDATVGKLDMVFTISGITITGLVLAKLDIVVVGVLGIDTISVLVLGRCRLITTTMGTGSTSTGSDSAAATGSWSASLGEGDGKKCRENNEDL